MDKYSLVNLMDNFIVKDCSLRIRNEEGKIINKMNLTEAAYLDVIN